jgi:hypothetical protein
MVEKKLKKIISQSEAENSIWSKNWSTFPLPGYIITYLPFSDIYILYPIKDNNPLVLLLSK